MNYETCHQLLQQLKSIDTLAISIGESEQLDKEMESHIHDITKLVWNIETVVRNEAIMEHMKRYLHIYDVLNSYTFLSEDDKANGYAELGAEIADLEDLIKDQYE